MNKDAYPALSDDVKSKMAFTPDTIEQAQMADWSISKRYMTNGVKDGKKKSFPKPDNLS